MTDSQQGESVVLSVETNRGLMVRNWQACKKMVDLKQTSGPIDDFFLMSIMTKITEQQQEENEETFNLTLYPDEMAALFHSLNVCNRNKLFDEGSRAVMLWQQARIAELLDWYLKENPSEVLPQPVSKAPSFSEGFKQDLKENRETKVRSPLGLVLTKSEYGSLKNDEIKFKKTNELVESGKLQISIVEDDHKEVEDDKE